MFCSRQNFEIYFDVNSVEFQRKINDKPSRRFNNSNVLRKPSREYHLFASDGKK